MALLTKEEALKFLEDVLCIQVSEVPDLSDQSTLTDVKLSFLEKLIKAFLEQEPFQSICLMSMDLNSRRRPHWEEVKRDLLLGRGGLCYWLGAFMYALLTALGFNASMTYSTYNVGFYSPNNHMIVLLHDVVNPGSLHLVDVGLGYYIPRAIPLDFNTYSPEYTDSFMTYKFCKESENKMYLLKRGEEITPAENVQKNQESNTSVDCKSQKSSEEAEESTDNVCQEDQNNKKDTKIYAWIELYFFNPLMAQKKLEDFYPCFDICFGDVTKLSTHSSPRVMCWPNGRYLALVNGKLIQELEEGKLTKTTIIETTSRPNPLFSSQSNRNPSDASEQKASAELQNDAQETKDVNDEVKNKNDAEETKDANDEVKNKNDAEETKDANDEIKNNNDAEETKDANDEVKGKNEAGDSDKNTGTSNGTASKSNSKDETEKCPKGESRGDNPDLEPLLKAYEQYFPRLPPQWVLAALKNWLVTGTIFPIPQHLT